MANPSNKILSMVLNKQNIPDVSSTTLSTTGLTAKSGNTLQWTINTRTIDDITSIGLINSPNVIGPINYYLYDSFDDIFQGTANSVGQIIPLKGEHIEKIVITANSTTSNGQPPAGLQVVINGCFKPELLRTKAQVENVPTTMMTGRKNSFRFFIIIYLV
jgi:hypothetical protein